MIQARSRTLLAALLVALSAAHSNAQTSTPLYYHLKPECTYTFGCFPPCTCPLFTAPIPSGMHVLQYMSTDAAGYDNYAVHSVDWITQGGVHPIHVTGSGQYRRGGMPTVHEQLILDLSVSGAAPEHFDSGLVVAQASFPRIDVAVALNGMFCQDKVYYIASEPDPGFMFCSGDGSGTACPCANAGAAGNGCASSTNVAGARLFGTGAASLSSESVVLAATGVPNAPLLFLQGTQRVNGGAGNAFGDGLLCVSGNLIRVKIGQAQNGEARVPDATDPSLSVLGGIAGPGLYDYQVWHRDALAFCTPSTFNLTNGYEIQWVP